MTLRQSAKHAPHCFGCMKPNPNGDLLALAHSNELRHGRGAYHKSLDIHGAILCERCHSAVDGRNNDLPTKEAKREAHRLAHDRTISWWWTEGYLVEGKFSS